MKLGQSVLKNGNMPYLIAEIGVNHEGSMDLAKRLIDLAKEGGAHAAKFQSYKAEKIAAKQSPSYWDLTKEKTTSQFELFKKYDGFGAKEYEELAQHCQRVGIDFLSTPFDLEAVDFLDPLMPFFKIASADINNVPLLRAVALKSKPVVLSTGSSRLGEIQGALEILENAGAKEVALLHCVLNYPTPDTHAHINMIKSLTQNFPAHQIGYSDHTVPDEFMTSLLLAYLNGAQIIEKHFTHDKSLPGNDHYHAMTAEDLKNFWKNFKKIRELQGQEYKKPLSTEILSRRNARRSLVTLGSMQQGEVLSIQNLVCKRPATGISPMYWDRIRGLKVNKNLPDDHILTWNDVDGRELNEKVVAIVQARMGSKRFPGKMMAPLDGRPVLSWVIERLKKSQSVSEIVLATSTSSGDDELVALAQTCGIRVYRGPEGDVLKRFVGAANVCQATVVVRICADNPFLDAHEVDRLIEFYLKCRPDYAFNHLCRLNNVYPDGFGAEIFSLGILQELDMFAVEASHREHVTSYIWDFADGFDIQTLTAPQELQYKNLRFDVDTPEDLLKLEKLANRVGIEGRAIDFIRAQLETSITC